MHKLERQEIRFATESANQHAIDDDEVKMVSMSTNNTHADGVTNCNRMDKNRSDLQRIHKSPSADAILSDISQSNVVYPISYASRPCSIDIVQDIGVNRDDNNDVFNPTPMPRVMLSIPACSSSAESASTTSTSNSAVNSRNHLNTNHQQQQQMQQPSPLRHDSIATSEGSRSADDTIQPNIFSSISSSLLSSVVGTASRRLSTSSSDSGADATISSNSLDKEIVPSKINPHYSHQNSQKGYQKKCIREARRQVGKREKDAKSVDELLANELNMLSFQERESINEEIHGIVVRNAGVEETPELLRKSFHQLEKELHSLSPGCVAFDRSQRMFGTTTYLNTEEFRIMFLRCDLFDCKKAASRLCAYAELMHEIFGDFALQRRPCLTDLTDLELTILEAGGYQVLPGRDRAGRRILGNLAFDAPKEYGVLSRLRVSTYCVMSFLEDVETQRKGAVGISWWHNVSVDDFIVRKKVHERINCVPLRLGAYHCCIPSEVKSVGAGRKVKSGASHGGVSYGMSHIIKAMAVLSVGSKLRPHLRFHTGSVVECIYALQSFGIHSDQIPVNSSSGKLKTKQHSKWLELRRMKEDGSKHNTRKFDRIIECPNQTDVLFGRGRPIMRHPGNAILRSVVQLKLKEYVSAKSKKQTTDVTWEVVRTLKGKFGARFLKEENIENNGLGWIEVSNETARQKVRIAFRDLRTKITKTNAAQIEANRKNDTINSYEAGGSPAKAKRKGESVSPTTTHVSISVQESGINSLQQVKKADSSTSAFLGMDGTNMKRQRRCF